MSSSAAIANGGFNGSISHKASLATNCDAPSQRNGMHRSAMELPLAEVGCSLKLLNVQH
jgi:hypothetical protein